MELTEYWRILRRHWLGGVAIVLATVAIAAAYTLTQPKVYSANANGFVSTGPADNAALSSVDDQLAKSRATSYVDIATSRATAQAVIEDLGLDARVLADADARAGFHGQRLLKITANASTPEEAQQLADAWVRALATQVQKIEDPKDSGAQVPQVLPVESAAMPTAPASPNPKLNLLLGAVLGLGLALGYAMLRHTLDRRLRSKEDIEAQFKISVVGGVPVSPVLKKDARGEAQLAVDAAARSAANGPASEAFRKLRTNLMYMNVDNPPRVVVVTSPMPGDGKSTVAANLAAAIDSSGENVVLIDGDLRRPTVATWFGLVEGVGLTDVLAGRIPIEDALQIPSEHPNLRVLGAGAIPPNPSELLGSQVMRQLLQKLSADALVLIDAPPLLPVTDAAVLTANADGALVVVSAGKTLDTQLGSALDHLSDVEATALGVVLNRVSPRDAGNGYYDQYSGYYAQTGRRRNKT